MREELHDCNIKEAFTLNVPLKIGIPGLFYGKSCYKYDSPQAKHFLLNNLRANKHININRVIPWFNSMFVNFFISDKGRKFFHFLRQLMIEGKQKNGIEIPTRLKNAFALLNFGIDSSLTGNKFAYEMNTNSVIKQIYDSLPIHYKKNIYNINDSGNPVLYYMGIIQFLQNRDLSIMFIRDCNYKWKEQIASLYKKIKKTPHVIIFEIFDDDAGSFLTKPISFQLKDIKYQIDSAVIRDVSQQHFSSAITAEGKTYGYDGMSFHKIIPLNWKDKLNSNYNWHFDGSLESINGNPMTWNFTKSYQLLFYYRIN
jgi:hypothetical protein